MAVNEYRELEIYIGPFAEWKGKPLDKKQAIKLVSNGNRDTPKIAVSISKAALSVWHTCTIDIYNLSQETRNAIKSGLSVNVYAGYEGQEKELVYRGGVIYSISDRQGADVVTKVSCSTAMGGLLLSNTSKTYTYGVPLDQAVIELANQIQGITVDPKNVQISGKIGYSGFSFAGSTKQALDKLAKQFGFSWTIDNDVFKAVTDGKATSDEAVLLPANGLRKVSPRINGLWMYQEGADIEAQYQPGVSLWKVVTVKSELNPNMSGKYCCHELDYTLCPKDSSWDMHIGNMIVF